jgi:hypothetical protein
VAVHEELCGHHVQPLAHGLTDTLHRLAAAARRARGLVAVLDATQMLGQRRAARSALLACGPAGLILRGERVDLRLQVGLVFGKRLLEQASLLGAHGLRTRAVLPCAELRHLEGQALDAGVLELDLALTLDGVSLVLGDVSIALGNVALALSERLLRPLQFGLQRGHQLDGVTLAQALQGCGVEGLHVNHVVIVATGGARRHGASSNCPARGLPRRRAGPADHTRVMTCICSSRCHGRPSTSASNCARVRAGVVSPARGQAKRPWLRRRVAHHTPKPSCTTSFTRVPRALANR